MTKKCIASAVTGAIAFFLAWELLGPGPATEPFPVVLAAFLGLAVAGLMAWAPFNDHDAPDLVLPADAETLRSSMTAWVIINLTGAIIAWSRGLRRPRDCRPAVAHRAWRGRSSVGGSASRTHLISGRRSS
jgi:hypothetical protein